MSALGHHFTSVIGGDAHGKLDALFGVGCDDALPS